MTLEISEVEGIIDSFLYGLGRPDVDARKYAAEKLQRAFAANDSFATMKRLEKVSSAFLRESDTNIAVMLFDVLSRAAQNNPSIRSKFKAPAFTEKVVGLIAPTRDENFCLECLSFAEPGVEAFPPSRLSVLTTKLFDAADAGNSDEVLKNILRLTAITFSYLPDDALAVRFVKFAKQNPTLVGHYSLELFQEAVNVRPPLLEREGVEKDLESLLTAQNPFVKGKAKELLCFAGVIKGEPRAIEEYLTPSKKPFAACEYK